MKDLLIDLSTWHYINHYSSVDVKRVYGEPNVKMVSINSTDNFTLDNIAVFKESKRLQEEYDVTIKTPNALVKLIGYVTTRQQYLVVFNATKISYNFHESAIREYKIDALLNVTHE